MMHGVLMFFTLAAVAYSAPVTSFVDELVPEVPRPLRI